MTNSNNFKKRNENLTSDPGVLVDQVGDRAAEVANVTKDEALDIADTWAGNAVVANDYS